MEFLIAASHLPSNVKFALTTDFSVTFLQRAKSKIL